MHNNKLNIIEEVTHPSHPKKAQAHGTGGPSAVRSYAEWVKLIRIDLRMTQSELAKRAKVPQSHIAAIESGKLDPRLSTLRKIFEALSCEMILEPRPPKPLQEILRQRARQIALNRLYEDPGIADLGGRQPTEELFKQIVDKLTNDILYNPKERLWRPENEASIFAKDAAPRLHSDEAAQAAEPV